MEFFFSHLNQFSVGFFLFFFIVISVRKRLLGQTNNLESIIGNSLSFAAVPTAIALILCAFNEELINKISGLNLHLSVSGMVLLAIAFRVIENDW